MNRHPFAPGVIERTPPRPWWQRPRHWLSNVFNALLIACLLVCLAVIAGLFLAIFMSHWTGFNPLDGAPFL